MALIDKAKEIEKANETSKMEFPSMNDAILQASDMKIFMIYGDKSSGKSSCAFGIMDKGDKVMVLSYDGMSCDPLELPYIKNLELNHKIINAVLFYDKSTDAQWLETADFTYNWSLNMLKESTQEDGFMPDWIVIDGFDDLIQICEMIMRKTYKLSPFAGPQIFQWKKRNQLVDAFHIELKKHAKKGIIYTVYPKDKNTKMKNGEVIESKQVPNWFGSVKKEVHIPIFTHSEKDTRTNSWMFYADIQGSKKMDYPDGIYDITNKRFGELLKMTNSLNNKDNN